MRKPVAIFMLAVFAFNVAGYQLYYNYISGESDATLELALDQNNYNDEDLITIKQPTNLPYYSNSKDFQRVDGEVEMDGIQYKYVKCRIYNDSLEMLCIPNKSKMQIEESKKAYAKVAHDFQQNDTKKQGAQNKSFQKSLSEYEELLQVSTECSSKLLSNNYVLVNSVFEETNYFTTEEHPPSMLIS